MLLLRKPKINEIRNFLDARAKLDLTYEDVGATANQPPVGYVVDHTRARLGEGDRVYLAAKTALEGWQQFRLDWLFACPGDALIRKGEVVAVVARFFGLWWLNACRIVYVIDEDQSPRRFGFAYGTLPDHPASGEERFLVEMDADGTVWYDILAFSRPHQHAARVGYPYLRYLQRRFGKQSAAAMQDLAQRARSEADARAKQYGLS